MSLKALGGPNVKPAVYQASPFRLLSASSATLKADGDEAGREAQGDKICVVFNLELLLK